MVSQQPLTAHVEYYGISPWEIEVIYSYFNSRFNVEQEEVEQDDPDFVSMLSLNIPLPFSEEFFKWFEFRRWEKVKDLFKEMKRRRGRGNALKVKINFGGDPAIGFLLDTEDRQWYNNAVEKIDFVLELLPYHLDPERLPSNISKIIYRFDPDSVRWRLYTAHTQSSGKFVFKGNMWKPVT